MSLNVFVELEQCQINLTISMLIVSFNKWIH